MIVKDFTTGMELFLIPIAGDWNKSAIKQLNDGVLGGLSEVSQNALDLKEYNWLNRLVNSLLINGSLIIVDKTITEGTVLFIEQTDGLETAYQLAWDGMQHLLKVWEKTETGVTVRTYSAPINFSSLIELKLFLNTATIIKSVDLASSEGIIFIENGRGVLVPGQATLFRLSELSDLLSKNISEKALRWFVNSYAADVEQLNIVSASSGPFGTIPNGADFKHMYDSAYTNDIFKQMAVLVPAFKEVTSNFIRAEGAESGIARFIGMQGYINKVIHTQKITQFVFDEQDISIEYDNIIFAAVRGELAT